MASSAVTWPSSKSRSRPRPSPSGSTNCSTIGPDETRRIGLAKLWSKMTYSVLVDDNLIALSWFGLPSVDGVQALERAFEQVARSQKAKIAFATRIHAGATPEKAPAE